MVRCGKGLLSQSQETPGAGVTSFLLDCLLDEETQTGRHRHGVEVGTAPQRSVGSEPIGQAVRSGASLSHTPESQPTLESEYLEPESARIIEVWERRKAGSFSSF